ncbi:type-1 restriction enzyme R protein [Thalassobacillus devorans]|uniref:Type I restriction enzyme endonuclease subunit n=1 Tax=Thalassobacillus devorans TaxID=279813 RepID=A0ABQ1NZK4_9BACI|nr:type I restriction endonuclease subunit R [Thalassobacillus devorans]NIK28206.1 type I restriction enzyme R subunit [Thalassobacillus devorans]GGC88071.1 type-1 restriction enzyme R protein [Thalassobacillus devorans]
MNYQSEAKLEENMIKQLIDQGYEPIKIPDYESLVNNFCNQVNQFNKEKLNGNPLTDNEFNRLLTLIEGKSIFASAKILRDKQLIERDDGTQVYIELFNTRKWCKNHFQVTTQTTVTGKYENRYDVTILINGLPLVQIELKRRGLDFKEAFNQIQRYRKHSYKGLYRFIQIFVISNGVDTKYFSNSDGDILYGYSFFWSDDENNIITNLQEFTASFLQRCHTAKMIARYMVISDASKTLLVLRPYQVYAVEVLVDRALETKNNGYIWHTTGSGKTLTSFKASQILANEPSIKKVFFLIDRQDLDSQTTEEFNKFQEGSVDETDKTDTLVKQIRDLTNPIIVTTIQKMANAVKNPRYAQDMERYKDESVIFIIDECHRSQFGKMHTKISQHFQNAQYFGFTGTPRLPENKSQDGRTTADLFEKCLHTYLIKEAIRDGNVLGFSVEYHRTFNATINEEDQTKVQGIDTDEIWMDDMRMNLVARNILDHHEQRSRSKGYSAIFTVDSIPMLVKYYKLFKEYDHNLKIAGIFTYGANEESEGKEEHSRDSLEEMIRDYNEIFSTNYSNQTWSGYFKDVSKKVKAAQIDILIVVRMFLTGFDSKTLNTLYVDKNLKHHDLLQAYSRTNRMHKATKPHGNIVCYRNLKENTDEAIRIFSKTDSVDDVLMKSYEEYLAMFHDALDKVRSMAPTPEDVDKLESEEEQKKFIEWFRHLSKILVRLETFTEFEFEPDELQIDPQTYEDFKSKYLKIADRTRRQIEKTSILQDIDFELELMHTDRINVDYIMKLISNLDFADKTNMNNDLRFIKEEMGRASDPELRLKVDLIKGFLDQVAPYLSNDDSVVVEFEKYKEQVREKEIDEFSSNVELSPEDLKSFIHEYEYSNIINQTEISDHLKMSLLKRRKLIPRIKTFIMEHTKRFA